MVSLEELEDLCSGEDNLLIRKGFSPIINTLGLRPTFIYLFIYWPFAKRICDTKLTLHFTLNE